MPPEALATAVHHVFLATAVVAAVMLCAVALMPRTRDGAQVPAQKTAEVGAG